MTEFTPLHRDDTEHGQVYYLASQVDSHVGLVMGTLESRERNIETILEESALRQAEIGRLTIDLAEADRRAGAAERRMADLEDTISKANRSRDRMKEEAGYHTNVSFDVVWAETLAKAKT